MKLKTVTVRYGRKRQPVQYESSEAMIEFTLSVDDDGEVGELGILHLNMSQVLLGQAKTLVLTEIGLVKAGDNASAHAIAAAAPKPAEIAPVVLAPAQAAETVAKKPTAAEKKAAKEAEEKAKPAAAVTVEAKVVPDPTDPFADESKPTSSLGRPLPVAKAAPEPGDIPVEETPVIPAATMQQTAATADALNAAGVQKYITQCLVKKKFLPQAILGVLKSEYKCDRVHDIPADKLPILYAKVREMAGETE